MHSSNCGCAEFGCGKARSCCPSAQWLADNVDLSHPRIFDVGFEAVKSGSAHVELLARPSLWSQVPIGGRTVHLHRVVQWPLPSVSAWGPLKPKVHWIWITEVGLQLTAPSEHRARVFELSAICELPTANPNRCLWGTCWHQLAARGRRRRPC